MKATINFSNELKNNVSNFRKEKGFFSSFSAIVPDEKGKLFSAIDLRFYFVGRDGMSPTYACIWIVDRKGNFTSGGGKASGCGYHKPSAAAQDAMQAAGVTLSKSISGVGEGAIERALIAICEAMGYTEVYIHHAHA